MIFMICPACEEQEKKRLRAEVLKHKGCRAAVQVQTKTKWHRRTTDRRRQNHQPTGNGRGKSVSMSVQFLAFYPQSGTKRVILSAISILDSSRAVAVVATWCWIGVAVVVQSRYVHSPTLVVAAAAAAVELSIFQHPCQPYNLSRWRRC